MKFLGGESKIAGAREQHEGAKLPAVEENAGWMN